MWLKLFWKDTNLPEFLVYLWYDGESKIMQGSGCLQYAQILNVSSSDEASLINRGKFDQKYTDLPEFLSFLWMNMSPRSGNGHLRIWAKPPFPFPWKDPFKILNVSSSSGKSLTLGRWSFFDKQGEIRSVVVVSSLESPCSKSPNISAWMQSLGSERTGRLQIESRNH